MTIAEILGKTWFIWVPTLIIVAKLRGIKIR